ncbi:hypothetical protein TNCV_2318201 [Trichonephila clavipes]|nr:hypothetical protein TNCV_2318201 [Trichonephila clavipes]
MINVTMLRVETLTFTAENGGKTRFGFELTSFSPGVDLGRCMDPQDHWQPPSQGHPLLRFRAGQYEKGPTVDG